MEERPPPSLVGPSCGGQEGLDPPFRGGAGRVRSREQAVGGAEQWEDPHVQSEHSKAECPVPRRQGQGSCGHTRAGLTLPGGRAPCPRERGPCGVMSQEGTCSSWLCMGREAGSQGLCPGDPAPQHAGPTEGSCGTAAAARQRPGLPGKSVVEMGGQAQGRDQSVPTAPRSTGTPVSWALTARGSLTLRSTLQKQGRGPSPSTEETRVQWRVEATFSEPPS